MNTSSALAGNSAHARRVRADVMGSHGPPLIVALMTRLGAASLSLVPAPCRNFRWPRTGGSVPFVALSQRNTKSGPLLEARAMSVAGERPRGPPGPRDAPGGSPAPRRKILVRKVKRPEGSVATSRDGLSTRATTPAQSGVDFGALSTGFESAGPVTARGGKATRPPPSAPGTPPEPATEAAVAPRGPRPGKRGKREEWTVLGDVGASRLRPIPRRGRERLESAEANARVRI